MHQLRSSTEQSEVGKGAELPQMGFLFFSLSRYIRFIMVLVSAITFQNVTRQ